MKKLIAFIFAFIILSLFGLKAQPAFAIDTFTASNVTFDPSTGHFTFDISNVPSYIDKTQSMYNYFPNPPTGQSPIQIYQAGPGFENWYAISMTDSNCNNWTHCDAVMSEGSFVPTYPYVILVNYYADGSNVIESQTLNSPSIDFPAIPSLANPIPNATVNVGDSYNGTESFSSSSAPSWFGTAIITVLYGDGGGDTPQYNFSDGTFHWGHVYTDPGTYTVRLVLVDYAGGVEHDYVLGTGTVIVNSAPPSVGTITITQNPTQVNSAISVSASFTDLDTSSTHTAQWDWGDGTATNPDITSGTITESNGSGSVNDSHTYTAAGVYTITLSVTNTTNGATGTQTFQYVSVYNPTSQGLFSAGQKYTSPAGAYMQNASLTGVVKFGLSYKYQGTVPTGMRQFSMDFNTANFHFNATTINSLVIANGIGTLTGIGTLNGSGTYNFLVTGSESANTIRIQITDPSNNNNVLYDTQPGVAATDMPTTFVTGQVLAH